MTEEELRRRAETAYQKFQKTPTYTRIRICDLAEQEGSPVPEDQIQAFMQQFNRLCALSKDPAHPYYHLFGCLADPGELYREDMYVCKRGAIISFDLTHFRDSYPVLTVTYSRSGSRELQLRLFQNGNLTEGHIYPLSPDALWDLLRTVNLIRESTDGPHESTSIGPIPGELIPKSCVADSDFWFLVCRSSRFGIGDYIALKNVDPALSAGLEAMIQGVHPALMESCVRLMEVR